MRSNNSSFVGVVDSRSSSLWRYCWSDFPDRFALWTKAAWTSSGTFRTWMLGMHAFYMHYLPGALDVHGIGHSCDDNESRSP